MIPLIPFSKKKYVVFEDLLVAVVHDLKRFLKDIAITNQKRYNMQTYPAARGKIAAIDSNKHDWD